MTSVKRTDITASKQLGKDIIGYSEIYNRERMKMKQGRKRDGNMIQSGIKTWSFGKTRRESTETPWRDGGGIWFGMRAEKLKEEAHRWYNDSAKGLICDSNHRQVGRETQYKRQGRGDDDAKFALMLPRGFRSTRRGHDRGNQSRWLLGIFRCINSDHTH